MRQFTHPQTLIVITGCACFMIVVVVWAVTGRDVPPGLQLLLGGIFGGALATQGISRLKKEEAEVTHEAHKKKAVTSNNPDAKEGADDA